MKRTFIAVDVLASEKLKEACERIRYSLRLEKIKWVDVSDLHITINFLGDTDEGLLPEMIRQIGEILKGSTPFGLVLRSFGIFRNLRDPRVLWIGCDPCLPLQKIKKELDIVLSDLGFEKDERDFYPHLTLGRIKGIRQLNQLSQLITLFSEVEFQNQLIDKVILYESTLKPDGPVYTPIHKFQLYPSN